jgi:AsmA protein
LTAATGFKRLGYLLAAVIAACIGVLTAATLLISTDAVRAQAEEEIRAVTGLNPVFRGDITVTLFPSGAVSFSDVTLGNAEHPALVAERLTARLRFFPLLIGRVEISDVALERPTINIDFVPSGRSNWSNLVETLSRSQRPSAPVRSAFSEIRVDDGTLQVRDDVHGINETFSHIEISLAWPSISKSFGATGRFMWRNEMLDASASVADFAAALAGNKSGLKLRIAGHPIKAAFDGSVSTRPSLRVEGTLAADATSLREAMRWAGQKPPPGGGFGRFALKAQTDIVGGTIAQSAGNVELDGHTAEGVLTFATDGRQTLQGTLAADTLDLRPYVSTVKLLTANQREWNAGRITLDGLAAFDLDLRLSAAAVVIAGGKLGRTAIGANLRGGHLQVSIGESQAFGGIIKGSLSLANFETGVDVKSQLLFSDVDLESCLGQLLGQRRLEGRGNITVALEGSGNSVLAITRTLTGSASLTGHDGSLAGLNVEQLLRRLERRPLSGGGELRAGRTAFNQMTVALKIAQGTIAVQEVKLDGAAVQVALAGSASIPERQLDLTGTARLVNTTNDAFELPFVVQGPWEDPLMLPDAQILIRRSGAAAPLLNARDPRARDAVRSVIERVIGGGRTPDAGKTTPAPAGQAAAPSSQ